MSSAAKLKRKKEDIAWEGEYEEVRMGMREVTKEGQPADDIIGLMRIKRSGRATYERDAHSEQKMRKNRRGRMLKKEGSRLSTRTKKSMREKDAEETSTKLKRGNAKGRRASQSGERWGVKRRQSPKHERRERGSGETEKNRGAYQAIKSIAVEKKAESACSERRKLIKSALQKKNKVRRKSQTKELISQTGGKGKGD